MLSTEIFEDIIKSFAEQGKLFSNERQFQLEIAWALKEKGYEVYLEVLEDKEEKAYIDLVVREADNEYIAIELKYTIRDNGIKRMDYHIKDRCVTVYAQGAGDIRRYDYLIDIQRIEKLMGKTKVFGLEGAVVTRGYAIIMTNDNYSGTDGKNTSYEEVALYQGRKIPKGKTLRLKLKGYEKKQPICLKGEYLCKWFPFELKNTQIKYMTKKQGEKCIKYEKYPFEYMIMEVK